MSQEKVDRYKEKKARRHEIYKKEKRMLALEKFAGILLCAVLVVWVGYSVDGIVTASQNSKVHETVMDTGAIDDYLSDLNTDEKSSVGKSKTRQKRDKEPPGSHSWGFLTENYNFTTLAACIPRAPSVKS